MVFACGGSVNIDNPVRLTYFPRVDSTQTGGTVFFPPANAEQSLPALVRACEPAGFGKGNKPVMDKEYRSASALPAGRLLTSFSLSETTIVSEVQKLLAPESSSIHARLYNLNVYEEGGFFKAHVDTPRGAWMFGTLVINLPTEFTGGDLEVGRHGQMQTFAWGQSPSKAAGDSSSGDEETKISANPPVSPATIQWCAFYADCLHEVHKVTNGYRVTLTNLLESEGNVSRDITAATKTHPFANKLEELLNSGELGSAGDVLGFALQYIQMASGFDSGTVPTVKGGDRFVKKLLDMLNLKHEFVPIFLASPFLEEGVRLSNRLLGICSASKADESFVYAGKGDALDERGKTYNYEK